MEKNNKTLKSSIEREQSQTCLNSAESEKIKGSTNLNVPHLRFPEFSGEWEETELQDIVPNICSGKDRISNNGEVTLYGSTGVIGRTNSVSYKENIVLVARVGANAGQMQIGNAPCGVTDNTLVIDAKEWNFYIYYFLQHYNLNRLVFGSGQPLITGGMLKKIKVRYGCYVERNKITHLLCLIDERIATQNKIIEDLKLLKSAIAETVFNNMKGHLTNLSAICNIVKGKQVNGEELSEKGKYYVMNGGITPSGYYDQCNTPPNTISISEGGNSCGYVQYNKSSFWSGGHCYTLQDITSGVDIQYLFHYLKRYESHIMNLRIGTGLPNIQKKDLENFRIALPPSNNQKEISTCLTAIEDKIMVEVKWLDSAQREKQHLLRQMFI